MAFTYDEFRYYKKSDDLEAPSDGYEKLVENLSTINNGEKLLPSTLINYFSLSEYNSNVLSSKLVVPAEIYTSDITFNRSTLWTSIISKSDNINLKNYYESIDTIDISGNEIFGSFMKSSAKLVVEFYTWSSILYASMYKGKTSKLSSTFNWDKIKIPNDLDSTYSVSNTDTSAGVIDSQYANGGGSFEENSVEPYNLSHIIDAIYEIDDEMNVRNELYNSTIEDNIKLNTKFESQDAILREKEKRFNKEKSFVITMMSKNKRIKSQYERKSLVFMIYLIAIIVYVLSVTSLIYVGTTNFQGVTNNIASNILISTGALILLGILMYDLLRYLF